MQSVNKTFEVLEQIAGSPEGMSLEQLCQLKGYPKTTVHRICKCLCQSGYLRQSDTGRYFLTTKMVTIGYSVIHHDALVTIATPFMSELANTTGFTVNLQRRDYDKILLLTKAEPRNSAFHTNAHPGLASSLLHSACGKVVLSWFSENEQRVYWQSQCHNLNNFQYFGDDSIQDEQDFFEELAKIKKRGYALDGEGNESGITCVAVPLEKNMAVSYAISVSGLTPEIHRFGLELLLGHLREKAALLAEKL